MQLKRKIFNLLKHRNETTKNKNWVCVTKITFNSKTYENQSKTLYGLKE